MINQTLRRRAKGKVYPHRIRSNFSWKDVSSILKVIMMFSFILNVKICGQTISESHTRMITATDDRHIWTHQPGGDGNFMNKNRHNVYTQDRRIVSIHTSLGPGSTFLIHVDNINVLNDLHTYSKLIKSRIAWWQLHC